MQVKAIRNFYWKDSVREKMVLYKKKDVFNADPDKDAEQIYVALQSRSIEIIDQDFIPERAKYVGVQNYSEQRSDGTRLKITPGQPVSLSQSEASMLLMGGYVKPELESQWRPSMLLTGSVSSAPAKKMFDEPEPPKENWAREYGVKGG